MHRLEVEGISKAFGGVQAVDNVSIKVKPNEIISVIGPNGAGKTTVFNLISGVYKTDSGRVILEGSDLTGKSQHEVTRAGIARTFQNIRLFKGLNVLENVMTAHDPIIQYNLLDTILSLPKKRRLDKQNRELSMHYLEMTGMAEFADEDPFNLPYGLQRKLEIARALATNPKVLLLDEPAAGLNPSEVLEFIELIKQLHSSLDLSIIIIDHRMQVVMELSKWIYVINFGKMLAEGTPTEIQNNDEVTRAYIGEED
ncbi:ABC transporter ATP-binding protein [Oscillospiraceae bacterium PP1C4]